MKTRKTHIRFTPRGSRYRMTRAAYLEIKNDGTDREVIAYLNQSLNPRVRITSVSFF